MVKSPSKQIQEKLKPILFYIVPLSSGILMGVTVAPVNAWFLAWIALAPLWVIVVKYTRKSLPSACWWAIAYHQ
ncbi:hypothetical protein C6N34_009700 [Cylindrospermopsis raciborskii Cr2010]|uniref:hypothetical protein n=1 Tax=Cylindrospermopsis raciborskii TaxID=77022 RepID=UPI001F471C73|nr:hypothetical protein [Cylindrospermopsis raciborskii]UJL32476.1 hypothetical protein C6N34_009700 [Cylindrospermopsis raciborskii Cr2010]UJS04929.1 hypothetical protein L3I90_01300 [Cylindrospermopsis raciborskii KLL07]